MPSRLSVGAGLFTNLFRLTIKTLKKEWGVLIITEKTRLKRVSEMTSVL